MLFEKAFDAAYHLFIKEMLYKMSKLLTFFLADECGGETDKCDYRESP